MEVEKMIEMDIICPKCGYNKSNVFFMKMPYGDAKTGVCKRCKETTFEENMEQAKMAVKIQNNPFGVACPFCHSTDCKKISTASKVGKVALFGVFAAGSVSKTWHCNSCGSNFG